jgi:hypothetical protein
MTADKEDAMWRTTALTAVAVGLAALAGCDLTEKDPTGALPAPPAGRPSPERLSTEHETCSRSADCAADLRCLDATCRRTQLSLLGDLHAAAGDRAISAGRADEAAAAYGKALELYGVEKIEPPAQLLCAHGGALAGQPAADGPTLERAARLLHRCLNAAPAGSLVRQRALGDLAALMDHGLNPALLAPKEPADLYLTGKKAAPTPQSIQIQAVVESRSRSASLRKFTELLEKSAEVRTAITPCWRPYFEATGDRTLTVPVPFQYGAAWDDDETYLSSWIKLPDGPAAAEPALAEASKCVREALTPLVEAHGKRLREEARWQAVGTFTFTATPR